eukprot:4750390-Prymnesium_polylepis.1
MRHAMRTCYAQGHSQNAHKLHFFDNSVLPAAARVADDTHTFFSTLSRSAPDSAQSIDARPNPAHKMGRVSGPDQPPVALALLSRTPSTLHGDRPRL